MTNTNNAGTLEVVVGGEPSVELAAATALTGSGNTIPIFVGNSNGFAVSANIVGNISGSVGIQASTDSNNPTHWAASELVTQFSGSQTLLFNMSDSCFSYFRLAVTYANGSSGGTINSTCWKK